MLTTKPAPDFRRAAAGASVPLAAGDLVRQSSLPGGGTLPSVWTPNVAGVDLTEWVRLQGGRLQQDIETCGGVLLRGFEIGGVDEFHRVAQLLGDAPLAFASNVFPRTDADRESLRAGSIYPPQLKLTWHNENSFDECRWTRKIMFYAHHPAAHGGETPICDGRTLLRALDPAVSHELMRRGICYVRNYHPELGNSWRLQFKASSHEEVEAHCREWEMDAEWLAGDRLRTRARRPAVIRHPRTRERLWFNVIQMWHVNGVAPETLAAWRGAFAPEDYPMTCTFGDGGAIDDAVMAEIHRAYEQSQVTFAWEAGDVLVLDNLLVTHGRNPFTGSREHYVAMDRQITLHDIPLADRVWDRDDIPRQGAPKDALSP
jgi:alpha-ketoglutarate-dependent taurine dioxygenase